MPNLYQALAAPSSHPTTGRTRPNPAAGAEVVGYFLDCLDLFIQKAVENALNKVQPVEAATSAELTGGIGLAQEITRLSKGRIYALVSERGIPHAKRGNKLYFNRAELLAWVAEGKRGESKK